MIDFQLSKGKIKLKKNAFSEKIMYMQTLKKMALMINYRSNKQQVFQYHYFFKY